MKQYIDAAKKCITDTDYSVLYTAVGIIKLALEKGNSIFICGNGGSAADAQHYAAELVGRFRIERKGIPAIALTNTANITAIANDYSYDDIFCRQLEALSKAGDVLVAISTSGKSKNILNAITRASRMKMAVISFGRMPGNVSFIPASSETSHIQEAFLIAWHTICDAIEQARKEY